MTIVEFLEARISEDEAQTTKHLAALSSHGLGDYGLRVLAECSAKRAIIESHKNITSAIAKESRLENKLMLEGMATGMFMSLAALTFPYKEHPDFNGEWAHGDH